MSEPILLCLIGDAGILSWRCRRMLRALGIDSNYNNDVDDGSGRSDTIDDLRGVEITSFSDWLARVVRLRTYLLRKNGSGFYTLGRHRRMNSDWNILQLGTWRVLWFFHFFVLGFC